MTKQVRQYELDIFRIIATIAIMLFHYTFRGVAADNMSILYFNNLGKIFKYGYFMIYLFFMISGYTIFLSATHKNFKDFIISRVLRLYPAFWICVTLTSIVTILLGGDRYHISLSQYIINLTMLNEYFGVEYVDGAHWFLFVILKFYFIVAIISCLNLVKYQNYLAGMWLFISIAITFFHIHIPILGFFLIPEYSSFIIAGTIFMSAKIKGFDLYKNFILVVSLLFSLFLVNQRLSIIEHNYHSKFSLFVTYSIIVFFYFSFYITTIKKEPIKLPNEVVVYGAASYPLYLLHQNIGYMIFNYFGKLYNKYLLLSVTSILMISLAVIIAKYVEPYLYAKARTALETVVSWAENIFRKAFA